MTTLPDALAKIAAFRAESPDFEDGSYTGATVFDFLDELQDQLEALAQPPLSAAEVDVDLIVKMLAHFASRCCYNEAEKAKWPNHLPFTEEQVMTQAKALRLAAPPVVVSEPDSPASIRASLEGIEPVGAGDGYLAIYERERAWLAQLWSKERGDEHMPAAPFGMFNMIVARLATNVARVPDKGRYCDNGHTLEWCARDLVDAVNAYHRTTSGHDSRWMQEAADRVAANLATVPAALVDDATTFAAFDAASNTYDASIKIRGDSHKRALLEACRAYTAALSAKGDGQ